MTKFWNFESIDSLFSLGNKTENDETTNLSDVLANCTKAGRRILLEELNLRRLFLSKFPLADLTTVLGCLTNLKAIDLSGNNSQNSPAVLRLCCCLSQKAGLWKVSLEQCGFTDADTPHLIEILNNSSLQFLSLMGNEILGNDELALNLFTAVSNSKSLESINAVCVTMTYSSSQAIARVLSKSKSLKFLRIFTKITRDIIQDMEKIQSCLQGNLPGISVSFGCSVDLLKLSAPKKSEHEVWRDRCICWPNAYGW